MGFNYSFCMVLPSPPSQKLQASPCQVASLFRNTAVPGDKAFPLMLARQPRSTLRSHFAGQGAQTALQSAGDNVGEYLPPSMASYLCELQYLLVISNHLTLNFSISLRTPARSQHKHTPLSGSIPELPPFDFRRCCQARLASRYPQTCRRRRWKPPLWFLSRWVGGSFWQQYTPTHPLSHRPRRSWRAYR